MRIKKGQIKRRKNGKDNNAEQRKRNLKITKNNNEFRPSGVI